MAVLDLSIEVAGFTAPVMGFVMSPALTEMRVDMASDARLRVLVNALSNRTTSLQVISRIRIAHLRNPANRIARADFNPMNTLGVVATTEAVEESPADVPIVTIDRDVPSVTGR